MIREQGSYVSCVSPHSLVVYCIPGDLPQLDRIVSLSLSVGLGIAMLLEGRARRTFLHRDPDERLAPAPEINLRSCARLPR